MKTFSITRRLIGWLAVSIAAFWIAATAFAGYIMHDEFGEIFDSSMQETAERLLPLIRDDLVGHEIGTAPRRLEHTGDEADDHLTYQVRDASGRVLIHSDDSAAVPFKAPLAGGFWQDGTVRVFTIADTGGQIFVQVADNLAHRAEAMQEGALALLVPMLILLPFSIGAMLFIVRRATAPLTRLRQAIADKDSGNLVPIAVDGLPYELLPIAGSINTLLTRLNAALGAEREFTANSAHELRTPIAGALAHAQLLMADLEDIEARKRAGMVEQSLRQLSALTEKLLQLARAEAGIGLQEEPVDLGPVIAMIAEDFNRHVGAAGRIKLSVAEGASLRHAVNPDAFAIALRNLIENALRHGEADAPVSIDVDAEGVIAVSNRARHFEANEVEKLRKRFVRGSHSGPGSGLGLSIVERILLQMGATLTLRSDAGEGGGLFRAIVRFEAA